MNKPIESFVYFVLDVKSNAVKIGKANDVYERLSTLQTGNPNELVLLHYFPCKSERHSYLMEKRLHNKFTDLHLNGEWFKYEKTLFDELFVEKCDINLKQRREALIANTIYGQEIIFHTNNHPRCFFYPELSAQIKESYENSTNLRLPYRTMKYPTYGKSLLLPFSNEKDRVYISGRKHQQNLELNRFLNKKDSILNENTLENFI